MNWIRVAVPLINDTLWMRELIASQKDRKRSWLGSVALPKESLKLLDAPRRATATRRERNSASLGYRGRSGKFLPALDNKTVLGDCLYVSSCANCSPPPTKQEKKGTPPLEKKTQSCKN